MEAKATPIRSMSPEKIMLHHRSDEDHGSDRWHGLKARRDALIVQVYDMKREVAAIQAEMDSMRR